MTTPGITHRQEPYVGEGERRCATCKFWDRANRLDCAPVVDAPGDIHYCVRPKMFWDATEWFDNPDEESWADRRLTADAKDDLMFVQDGSDYKAYLITRGAFFCAHWQPVSSGETG